eukprot:9158313-Lingulodinium_polyedra.AAC.1
MSYQAKLRVLGIRDIYHREWNDTTLALKACSLWYVVLLTAMAMNLPYGPWDGSAWMGKMVESAQTMRDRTMPGELWARLHDLIQKDKHLQPALDPLRRLEEFQEVTEAKGLLAKGPRVALRRWFSWFQAAA